jgi:hypothetical protein
LPASNETTFKSNVSMCQLEKLTEA